MSWTRIRGHDANIASFQAAWKKGRLGHAYLFVGPSGIGKHTFASELAAAYLCERKSETFQACGQCASCALVTAGTHPDLYSVGRPEDKNELPLDIIKELMEQLSLKTARGHGKIAILSDAADLNAESANAFLKYLEEPPLGSLLILLGGPSTDGQLPTILSRCQVVRFKPLNPPLIQELLQVNGVTEARTLERLVRMSNGSVGQALALNEEALWNFRQKMLQTLGAEKINTVEVGAEWVKFIEEAGKDSAKKRRRASHVLQLLLGLLQDAQRIANGVAPLVAEESEAGLLGKLAERLGPEKLLDWIDRTIDADIQIDRYVQIELLIEAFTDYLGR